MSEKCKESQFIMTEELEPENITKFAEELNFVDQLTDGSSACLKDFSLLIVL